MKIDTGALLTLVSECTLHGFWLDVHVTSSKVKLHLYSGESMPVLGTVDVLVKYGDPLFLLAVKGVGPSLLGKIGWV